MKVKIARFERVITFAEVEAFQVGIVASERTLFLQMKLTGVEFPSLIVLSHEDALGLASVLTGAVNETLRTAMANSFEEAEPESEIRETFEPSSGGI